MRDPCTLTLLEAIPYENNEKIQALIKEGANVNSTDDYGRTPIYKACQPLFFDWSIIKLLLENNGNINARDLNGCTPAMHFIFSHYADCKEGIGTPDSSRRDNFTQLLKYSDINIKAAGGHNILDICGNTTWLK